MRIRSSDTVLLTDPFKTCSEALRGGSQVNIVTVSIEEPDHATYQELPGKPRLIQGPGEYEILTISIRGLATRCRNSQGQQQISTLYLIEAEGITLCHLGSLGEMPSSRQVEELSQADVLFVPTGGGLSLDHKQAAEVINLIAPKIAVPIHYRSNGSDQHLQPLTPLLKEMGLKDVEPKPRLNITRTNLPQETTLVVLQRMA